MNGFELNRDARADGDTLPLSELVRSARADGDTLPLSELNRDARADGDDSVETGREDGGSDDGQDPTIRIKILDAANRKPVWVNPNATLKAATSIMELHDFSQLPVMQKEDDRRVTDVVSWKSITAAGDLNRETEFVRHWMDPAEIIDIETPLLDAVEVVRRHGYVLVKDKTNTTARCS